jgi:putative protease
MFLPELLAPAGNLEKLKTACLYGADAVYVGGVRFGLRSGADNFTHQDLVKAARITKEHGVKLYVTMNAFLHNQDMEGIDEFVSALEEIGVAALIVSDMGVIRACMKFCKIPIHLSTQATCINIQSAKLWKEMGIDRIITGRELTVQEGGEMKRQTGLEVEMFIHGAMCSAYSGNCTISNYTAGRDSNRGGCKQSCRFEYQVPGIENKTTFMSSKDLLGLDLLPQFFKEEIDSIKVEGRMKSQLYVAATCKAYRNAIDHYAAQKWDQHVINEGLYELQNVANRGFTHASLEKDAEEDSITPMFRDSHNKYSFVGSVLHSDGERAYLQLKNPIQKESVIEFVTTRGTNQTLKVDKINDFSGAEIDKGKQNQIVYVPLQEKLEEGTIIREVCQ